MDLFTTQQLNAKPWNIAKQAAFFCFVVACALLGASLVLNQPGEIGHGATYGANVASPAR